MNRTRTARREASARGGRDFVSCHLAVADTHAYSARFALPLRRGDVGEWLKPVPC